MTTLGAILTGGESVRMGQDKATVEVRGKPMLDCVADALRDVVDSVVLLGPDRPGWVCWPDAVHTQGPLAGIATALSRSHHDHVVVVAVDQPFVQAGLLTHLIELASTTPVVPVDHDGVRQVTCAVYPVSVATQAVDEAANRGSIQTFLDRVSFQAVSPDIWTEWGEDGRSWFSVDTPEAMARSLELF